jgi:hypothetical protein
LRLSLSRDSSHVPFHDPRRALVDGGSGAGVRVVVKSKFVASLEVVRLESF